VGSSFRYTYYDDNTTATSSGINDTDNDPDQIYLPGIFVQDEIKFNPKHTLLLGLRYDYNDDHGSVFTPRIAYKWGPSTTDNFRINVGTGFRVVSLFTEDHAALTGSRDVVVAEELLPEQSININLNYTKRLYPHGSLISVISSCLIMTLILIRSSMIILTVMPSPKG